jgi:hypothetical protein
MMVPADATSLEIENVTFKLDRNQQKVAGQELWNLP